jgi:hypothetical protein
MVRSARFSTADNFFTKKILMLVGKHINAYLLAIVLDFIIEKVEYRLELSAPLGCF